ncbi:DUF4426 domain-containing protein [Alteromonas sp. C1M14]|uniref:DUF4426 domain-containing protein n=1 Tax=Alteromonas sp. C1M14 TaxID=2841567 RepID=UPI001C08A3CA|nr:DUF4426 domain-containing protein [Alteromonas sp. C1M14]MBU2979448.1 DUF4426 domain-containing protein [Alteromonas sp. C1M14]
MSRLPSFFLVVIALLTLGVSSTSHAEQKQTLGDWDVHYMVVNTTFLSPEVAREYGIVRSKFNALVNISVLDSETQAAQRVSVTGNARNLLGNSKALTFRRVNEGDAVYYLAPISFSDRETFRFSINIQLGNNTQTLQFQQEMFVE